MVRYSIIFLLSLDWRRHYDKIVQTTIILHTKAHANSLDQSRGKASLPLQFYQIRIWLTSGLRGMRPRACATKPWRKTKHSDQLPFLTIRCGINLCALSCQNGLYVQEKCSFTARAATQIDSTCTYQVWAYSAACMAG
jgi:hypothetical protein